jgi:hypothetical protein
MQSETTIVNLNAQAAAYVCPECQAESRATAKYCRKCGIARIENSVVASPAEQFAPEANFETIKLDYSHVEAIATLSETTTDCNSEPSDQSNDQSDDQIAEQVTVQIVQSDPVRVPELVVVEDEGFRSKLVLSSDLGITSQIATDPNIVAIVAGSQSQQSNSPESAIVSNVVLETSLQAVPEKPITQRQCASCQTRIRLSDKFCIWCGTKQPASTSLEFKTCSFCLVPIPTKAAFCSLCGITVEANYNQESAQQNDQQEDPSENSPSQKDTTEEPVFFYEDDWLTKN